MNVERTSAQLGQIGVASAAHLLVASNGPAEAQRRSGKAFGLAQGTWCKWFHDLSSIEEQPGGEGARH